MDTPFHPTLAALRTHGVASLTPADTGLRRLPIADIQTWPDVFQPRSDVEATAAHGHHLAELMRVLGSAGTHLTPITVLKINTIGWVVIDGFHRLKAYREVGGRRTHIPVTIFTGSLDEAVRFSIAANAPDKLNMTLSDKREAAWRMVGCGVYTQAEISQTAGVSESTVDRMRRAVTIVKASHPDLAWETYTWVDLKWALRGQKESVDMGVEWMKKRARQVAVSLTKHFKGLAKDTPVIFAEGLMLHDPKAAAEIARTIMGRTEYQRLFSFQEEDF